MIPEVAIFVASFTKQVSVEEVKAFVALFTQQIRFSNARNVVNRFVITPIRNWTKIKSRLAEGMGFPFPDRSSNTYYLVKRASTNLLFLVDAEVHLDS